MDKLNCPKCNTVVDFDINKVNEGLNFKLCPNDNCFTELECIINNIEIKLIAHDL